MSTSGSGYGNRDLVDGRQYEVPKRSPDIINRYNKDKSVPPTKPYAGPTSVPFKNSEVPEIKPFNNAYVLSQRPLPEVPQMNNDRKAPIQQEDTAIASVMTAPSRRAAHYIGQFGQMRQASPSAPNLPIYN